MSDDDRWLLQAVARVVLLDDAGTLSEQVERRGRTNVSIPQLKVLMRIWSQSQLPWPRNQIWHSSTVWGD